MFDDEDEKPQKDYALGMGLDDFSVKELNDIIKHLHAEIARCEADIKKKKASAAAAESVFKS